jgi:hypothetical protein
MDCHLGWHFAVCCPLRGGRGVFIKKHQKTIKEKKKYLEKCVFATPSPEILGHTISAAGADPRPITPPKLNFAHHLRMSNNCNASLAW